MHNFTHIYLTQITLVSAHLYIHAFVQFFHEFDIRLNITSRIDKVYGLPLVYIKLVYSLPRE